MRTKAVVGGMLVLLALIAGQASAAEITVSPSTINLAYPGSWVTVHTDLAFRGVVEASVTLNGVPINWSKSDAQGNFVAKFVVQEVKTVLEGVPTPTEVELTLVGVLTDGTSFSGTDSVRVVNVEGRR